MSASSNRRVALFWGYSTEEPSFRHRMLTVVPELSRRGWECRVEELPSRRYVRRVLERRGALRSADLLVLHRIKPSPLEYRLLRSCSRRIVYDVDDAIYFRQPRRLGDAPDRSWFRRYKFARTCSLADLVIVCNRSIERHALRSADRVRISPTPVDLARYEEPPPTARDDQTIVWIGLPENLAYLEIVRPVLTRLAREFPRMRLRVISSRCPDWSDVPLEPVPWSAAVEVSGILGAGIGIMPLSDDDWTRGKCAFKLLQYMAAGLPCVASAVGANLEAIEDGVNGFLARDAGDWERSLRTLLDDPGRASAMGEAGRRVIRERYDVRVVVPAVADLLEEVAGPAEAH